MSDPSGPAESQELIYARELQKLNRLRRTYERLLPEALDPQSSQLAQPRVCEGAILFTDLRGFTRLAEQLQADPLQLFEVVNEHFAAAIPPILHAGGVVEKFVGDGILASFGVRSDVESVSARAVAAAIGVVNATDALNRQRASEWGFELEVGVGVAAGRLVLGRLGAAERAEVGVIGDPVNVAARLVAAAQPGEILLTASVYDGLLPAIRADMLGSQPVRGRVAAIDVYRLSLRPTEVPADQPQ